MASLHTSSSSIVIMSWNCDTTDAIWTRPFFMWPPQSEIVLLLSRFVYECNLKEGALRAQPRLRSNGSQGERYALLKSSGRRSCPCVEHLRPRKSCSWAEHWRRGREGKELSYWLTTSNSSSTSSIILDPIRWPLQSRGACRMGGGVAGSLVPCG